MAIPPKVKNTVIYEDAIIRLQIILKYMISISETFIKKQSREYAIDSIGLPALLTIDANPEGTCN